MGWISDICSIFGGRALAQLYEGGPEHVYYTADDQQDD